jgi:hypothetical protein
VSITFTFGTVADNGATSIGLLHEHLCPTPDACEDAQMYSPACCDHAEALVAMCGCQHFDVNASSANASVILSRMGIAGQMVGTMDAEDYLGRVLLAQLEDPAPVMVGGAVEAAFGVGAVEANAEAHHWHRLERLAHEARLSGWLVAWA